MIFLQKNKEKIKFPRKNEKNPLHMHAGSDAEQINDAFEISI